jgi:imidazolonepropionase-like amidohydrolase
MPTRPILRLFLALLLTGVTGVIAAQTPIAIRAGHLIDPATGEVTGNQTILVTGNEISAVGEDVELPAGTDVIDLSDAWVMPGLMDAHVHLSFNAPQGSSYGQEYLTESSGFRALRGAFNARLVLESGFTTVRDIGNSGNWVMADVRRAMAEGWYSGPTIFDAGKIIAPYGGQLRGMSPDMGRPWEYEYIDADTPDEIRKAVRQNIYYGANTIKLVTDSNTYFYSEDEIRAAVHEAMRAGLKVSVHAMGGQAATNAILGGAHSIEHGWRLTDEHLELMKEHGTYLVGTDFPEEHLKAMNFSKNNAPQIAAGIIDRLARAWKIGTPIAFGTDTVVDLPDMNRAQMNIDFIRPWIAAGIPAPAILKAMTTHNAILFGIEDERGAIRPGLKADIVATPDNPLADINALRVVDFVMKDGSVIRKNR